MGCLTFIIESNIRTLAPGLKWCENGKWHGRGDNGEIKMT